jgi:hypothetical protein
MPAIQGADFADLIVTTLNQLGRLKFTDLMSTYQNTIALKRLIKKSKMTFEGGPAVEFRVITDTNGSARAVGLAYVAISNIPNVMTFGQVPWRHVTWNWSMERRILAMNAGTAQKITDIIKVERVAAMGDAIKMFERFFWRVPATTDTLTPYGIPYYVVKSATAATSANADGFNGLVPAGYTTVAGLNPTTYPQWANYADAYTTVSKDDLIRKMRRACRYTEWTPLVDDIPQYSTGDDYGIYTNYPVMGAMEEILESQNENLGPDVASMDNKTVFQRTPITWVKELDLDTTNPVYGLNWGEMKTMGLTGEWMKETMVPVNPNQPTVQTTHTDCTYNLLCRNRRKQYVLSTGTSMSY